MFTTMRFAPEVSIGSVVPDAWLPTPDAWLTRPMVGGFEADGERDSDEDGDEEIEVEGLAEEEGDSEIEVEGLADADGLFDTEDERDSDGELERDVEGDTDEDVELVLLFIDGATSEAKSEVGSSVVAQLKAPRGCFPSFTIVV